MKDYAELLRKNELKVTPKRVAVLKLLDSQTKPRTIAEILAGLRGITIDQVTVYRILEMFKQCGLVKQLALSGPAAYFEIAGEHHHHVVCTNCNTVEDVHLSEEFKNQERGIEQQTKFKINSHSLEFYGLCKDCKK